MTLDLQNVCDEITREDMPNEDMLMVWDEFGPEVAVRMILRFGGIPIIPPKTGLLRYINRKIKAEFRGNNAKDLARRWSVSVRHVYNVIEAGREKLCQERLAI